MEEKGINPVISSILLVVITLAVGMMFMQWTITYNQEQMANEERISDEQIECSEAGFQIKSCSFDSGDTNIATIQLENTGYADLNSFTVVAEHSAGSSDVNICSIDLEEGAFDMVYIQVETGKSLKKIKVVSRDCKTLQDSTTDCS